MLQAPVPLIVGITPNEYKMLEAEGIIEQEHDQKIWINLQLVETEPKAMTTIESTKTTVYRSLKIENL